MKTAESLTKQEIIVLALVAKGHRNTEIAGELVISIKTVETHLYRIFSKLGVSSRTQAALYALSNNLISHAKIHGITDDAPTESNYA